MIAYPEINPVAFSMFGFPVHWYGVMYLLSFICVWRLGNRLLRLSGFADLKKIKIEEFLNYGVIGVIVGGRLGYVLFYQPSILLEPLEVLKLWNGGMSFHGGILGVIVALWFYGRRSRISFLRITDLAAVLTPIGLGLGRIGNFINGELPGRIATSELPWGMIFSGERVARHPSSIYQAILEGGVLLIIMLYVARRPRRGGFLSAIFLIGYAILRLFSEFFRQPDPHLGLLVGGLSMGQLLSLPMLIAGISLIVIISKNNKIFLTPTIVASEQELAKEESETEETEESKTVESEILSLDEEPEEALETDEQESQEVADNTTAKPVMLRVKKMLRLLNALASPVAAESLTQTRLSRRTTRRRKKKN